MELLDKLVDSVEISITDLAFAAKVYQRDGQGTMYGVPIQPLHLWKREEMVRLFREILKKNFGKAIGVTPENSLDKS